MKNQKTGVIRKISIWVGACLLVIAIAILISWQYGIHTSAERTEYYVNSLSELMPTPQGAVPEARRDNAMATVSLEGTDFIGILELPRYSAILPVGAKWGQPNQYPCRFSGSVYDRTLQIGGTSQKGQLDFFREISVGDTVLFTDMEGNRYTYAVTDLRYEKSADQAALRRKESALTLFIKNVYAFEYLIVFCNAVT